MLARVTHRHDKNVPGGTAGKTQPGPQDPVPNVNSPVDEQSCSVETKPKNGPELTAGPPMQHS
eukprot:XP_001692296.1 predicted protein [Chlamydomonas reinhardtii]